MTRRSAVPVTPDAPEVVHYRGWWWPTADARGKVAILRDCDGAIFDLLKHVSGRDCIVQAGACVGVYPIALADHFQRVVTAEPDAANLACLWRNLMARDPLRRVDARCAAFGEELGVCHLVHVEPDNCGAHRIEPGSGAVAIVPIDSLGLTHCDAIWLDIEGHELAALKGARQTIEEFRPVIAIEDKGLSRAFGVERGDAGRWLAELGYEQADQIGLDKVYRSMT